MMKILAGDVGGTKTRLALYEEKDGKLERSEVRKYESKPSVLFRDMVRDFLTTTGAKVEAACFGVPGPVINGVVSITNLPWKLSESELKRDTGIHLIKLVNDLVAFTSAVPRLRPEELVCLHDGSPGLERDVCAVLAPGTGLGQGYLHRVNGKACVVASEGGHVDFAPTNEIEIGLLRYLLTKHQRVSYERVLCGPGLVNIYSYLKEGNFAPESADIEKRFTTEDAAAVISSAGIKGEDELCVKAVDIFVSVLGAQAGNLVLSLMATGGIYLGGGIPPKILPKLKEGQLISSYLSKGRLSRLVAGTPLYVILDDHVPLLGSAEIATQMVAGE